MTMYGEEIAGRGDLIVVRATGRRARRLERRAEQQLRPEVYELWAIDDQVVPGGGA